MAAPAEQVDKDTDTDAYSLSLALLPIALHCCSRGLLLFKLARGSNCSSVSLVALDLYVLVRVKRCMS